MLRLSASVAKFTIINIATPAIFYWPRDLFRSKNTIPCVTEAGQDIAMAIQLAVNCSGVDSHVRVRCLHRVHALGAAYQADKFD